MSPTNLHESGAYVKSFTKFDWVALPTEDGSIAEAMRCEDGKRPGRKPAQPSIPEGILGFPPLTLFYRARQKPNLSD
jgi:hypothetical protein